MNRWQLCVPICVIVIFISTSTLTEGLKFGVSSFILDLKPNYVDGFSPEDELNYEIISLSTGQFDPQPESPGSEKQLNVTAGN